MGGWWWGVGGRCRGLSGPTKSDKFFYHPLEAKGESSPGVTRFVIAAGNTRGKTGLSTRLGAGDAFFDQCFDDYFMRDNYNDINDNTFNEW